MAGGITALIAVLVAVIIIVFILLRYCMHGSNRKIFVLDYVFLRYHKNAGRKYSLKEGNFSTVRKAHPTEGREGEGSNGEGEEGNNEEIELESPLVHVVAEDNETHEEDGATVEEKDDYFQDPTSICKIYTRALPFFSWHHMDFSVMGNNVLT